MTIAITVGLLMFGAVYLFSKRELLRVILGMVLLGHAANLAIIAAGGTDRRTPLAVIEIFQTTGWRRNLQDHNQI